MRIKDKDDELYIYFEIFIRVVLFVFVSVKNIVQARKISILVAKAVSQ